MCPECKCVQMDQDLRRGRTGTRGIHFPSFKADHMRRLEGEKTEISSLKQIRDLERKHSDQKLCFEKFSYDSEEYGSESPTGPEQPAIPYDPNRPVPKEFQIHEEIGD